MFRNLLNRRKTVLAAILLFVCGIGIQLWRDLNAAREAAGAVEHAYRVLTTNEEFLASLRDAETGQRGYLLTDDETYLQPYRAALANEPSRLARLAGLVAGNAAQLARVKEMDRLARQKLDELDRTVRAQQGGNRRQAMAIVRSGGGKRLMDELRALVRQVDAEEREILVQRNATGRQRAVDLERSLLMGFTALLVMLAAAGVSAERYIDSRDRAVQAQGESEERLCRVLENLPAVVVLYDRERRIQYINSYTSQVSGMRPEQFLGKREEEVFPPETAAPVVTVLEAAYTTLTAQSRELDLDLPGMGTRHLLLRCVPLLNDSGMLREVVGITQDLTEWKRAQLVLQQQAEREVHILQTMVAAAPAGLVMLDRNLRQVQCSQRWLDDVGLTRDQVIGKPHYESFPELPEAWKEAHRRGLNGESLRARDELFTAPDGGVHWVNWGIQPWGDQGETTGGIIIFSEDITGRKRAEQSVAETEMRYRALFEHMSEGLAYCDTLFEDGEPRDFIYRAVNASFGVLTGLHDVVGKRVSELIPGIHESDPGLIRIFGRVAVTGQPEKLELYVAALGMWFSVSAYCPKPGSFVAVFDVITERKRAELAAREWRRAFEQAEIGIALVDPKDDTFTAVNATFARERGYRPDELVGRSIMAVNPPERAAGVRAIVEHANHGSGHAAVEWVHRRKDGSCFPVFLDLTGVRDEHGQLVSRVIIAQDLTEKQRAEQERQRVEALYREIARNLPGTGVFVVDRDLRYVAVEGDLPARLGTPREVLLGRYVGDVLKLPVIEEWRNRFRRALEAVSGTAEVELEGCAIWARFVPLRDASGAVTAAMALATDITVQKRAAERILRLNEELEERVRERTVQLEATNKELEAFSYSVSHDLRAPLRGIDGWSQALIEDYGSNLDPTALGYLSRVRSETQRMGLLIDDLLQLSRLSRTEMRREDIDLSAMARRIAARLREENPQRRIEFTIQDGLCVPGDTRLLEVAFTNLLSNAVKFTGPRPIAHIEVGATEAEGGRVFFVRDNGVGFDMAYASALFGAFQRLHKMSQFPGTGIGLATVQRVVRRHGGRVWAQSEPDAGATFYFTIGDERQV